MNTKRDAGDDEDYEEERSDILFILGLKFIGSCILVGQIYRMTLCFTSLSTRNFCLAL